MRVRFHGILLTPSQLAKRIWLGLWRWAFPPKPQLFWTGRIYCSNTHIVGVIRE